jgi:5'-nucleotidase
MDDVLCEYTSSYNFHKKKNPEIVYPQSQYGFFSDLHPLAYAKESMKKLMNSSRYDPYILTAPSCENPLSYTEKRVWVERHLGMEYVERLIISPNKGLLLGDYLIDDNIEGKGQENFTGELIHFGSFEYPNWEYVCKYLSI